jgi:adenylate cyclase
MVAPRLIYFKMRTLIAISLIWMIFGVVFFYNLIDVKNDLGVKVSLLRFLIVFGIIGFLVTATLIFYLKFAFNHYPLWIGMLIKLALMFCLFILISFLILTVYYVFIYHRGFQDFTKSFFTKIMETKTFRVFIADLGIMTLLSIVLIEVTDKYGPGMFWSMLRGEYHKPKKENRIFLFLDINASTSIAEQLGHEKYFRMLRDFFNDITVPVLANGGEIYQYVGDEVVVTWKNTSENKIKTLKFIRNTFYLLKRRDAKYQRRYGLSPEFKAGVHAGEVTAGFIGIIKRDLVYSGDTLNTAARIRSMCNELNQSFILSEDFMHDFHQPYNYEIIEIGKMELKGKEEPIKLYSLKFD